MSKIKLGYLIGASDCGALQRFSQASVPWNTADKLQQTYADINEAIHDYNEKKFELIKEYMLVDTEGKPVEKEGGGVQIDPERLVEFSAKVGAMAHQEVHVRNIPYTKSQMSSTTNISQSDRQILDFMIPIEKDEWAETVEVEK